MSVPPVIRRLAGLGALLLATGALVLPATLALPATPAGAAGPVGYVRLAHLSPDTPDVDVNLTTVGTSGGPQVFPGVGYGTVSTYLPLPVGTYAVAMRGAGAPASDPPVLTTNVTVEANQAYTVAGVGKHAELGLKVITDDLSLPAKGSAKVRVVQASLTAPVLTVSITGGAEIASGVAFASTTNYLDVAPGQWNLQVHGAGGTPASTLPVTLHDGNVYSLLVLDKAGGGLTSQLRVDATRTGPAPLGGVATGAGGTQPVNRTPVLAGGLLLGLLLIGAGTVAYRRGGQRRGGAVLR